MLQATACTPSATCKYDYTPSSVRMSGAAPGGLIGAVTLADISFLVIGPSGSCSDLTITVITLTDPTGALALHPSVVHGKNMRRIVQRGLKARPKPRRCPNMPVIA